MIIALIILGFLLLIGGIVFGLLIWTGVITAPRFTLGGGGMTFDMRSPWVGRIMIVVTIIVGLVIFKKFLPEASHRMWHGGWLTVLMFITLGIAIFWDSRHKSFRPLIFFALTLIMFIKLVSVQGGEIIEKMQAKLRGQEVEQEPWYKYNLIVSANKAVILGQKEDGQPYFPKKFSFRIKNENPEHNIMLITTKKDTIRIGPKYTGAEIPVDLFTSKGNDSLLIQSLDGKQIVLPILVYHSRKDKKGY